MEAQVSQDNVRDAYLEKLFKEGLELGDYNIRIWQAAAIRCLEIGPDREAIEAFTMYLPLPSGVKGAHLAKAADLFPKWFENDSEPTLWELFTLFNFARVSKTKAKELYEQWIKTDRSWSLLEIKELVERKGARSSRSSDVRIKASVKFVSQKHAILIKPDEEFVFDGLANDTYRIHMRRTRRKE